MKDLHVQKLKLEHTKKSFLYTGSKAWNSIPQLIRDTESVVRFKKDLKSHLLSWYKIGLHESMEDQYTGGGKGCNMFWAYIVNF